MKFAAAVLAFAATALAAPSKPATGPPNTEGQCLNVIEGPEPGQWVMKPCALFFIPPGSTCTEIPGDLSKPYPDCCPTPSCPESE